MALGLLSGNSGKQQAITLEIEVDTPKGPVAMRALLDSGAQANFISQLLVMEIGAKPLSTNVHVRTVAGQPIRVYGEHRLNTYATDMRGERRKHAQSFVATDIQTHDAILGYPWLQEVNPMIDWGSGTWQYQQTDDERVVRVSLKDLMADSNNLVVGMLMALPLGTNSTGDADVTLATMQEGGITLPEAYQDYIDVFEEPEAGTFADETKTRHSIPVKEGETVPYGPIYPLSKKELDVLRDYIENSMRKGWIQPSESPAGAPILFVPKRDTDQLRLCVDYRALNKITRKNRYPLPLIPEVLDRLSGAKIYTKLDLRDAYHRIRIAEEDRWKTAFRTRYGHYEYLVMPFGLTNAPATFQAYINEALRGLLDDICVAYMDDILIYSSDTEEHEKHVRLVLERLRKYRLYIKLSKCDFYAQEVGFLGYRVGVAGVSMDPSRVTAIQEWPTPKSFREIQVFLGFANFYRGFIHKYSAVVAPITDLLTGMVAGKKTGPFHWTDDAERAFRTLKERFASADMLTHFEPERQSRIEVDASGRAIGGVLTQAYETQGGRTLWKPVAFFSRKMNPAERNYHTGDGEMLAIVEGFKVWRHYLEAPAFSTIVLTDHEALQSFMTTKVLNRRQMRWAEVLAAYDFTIQWRRGKDNPADGLSRRPDHLGPEEEPTENLLVELLKKRVPTVDEQHADHMRVNGERIVGVLTRSAVQASRNPTESIYNVLTLPPPNTSTAKGDRQEEEPSFTLRQRTEALAVRLKELQDQDVWCQEARWSTTPNGRVIKGAFKGTWTVDHAKLVRRDGVVYVPRDPATRQEILRVNHDDPWQGGHFGRTRTHTNIARHYWWPQMRSEIDAYVKTCDICQRMKVPRHKPYGQLEPLPQPKGPWQDISMDFIVGLPPSVYQRHACDSILVVVDRFSKMVILVPCRSTIDAVGLGQVILERVVAKFGAPKTIVSDRGSTFTSTYWGALCSYLATRRLFSTAFHPQTDGQTERMNQTLESYLRCYVNYQQSDWAELLSSAEYAMNSAPNATTGESPFDRVLRFTPTLRVNLERESHAQTPENATAERKAKGIAEALDIAREAYETSEKYMRNAYGSEAKYYNKKRTEMHFEIGQKVLLAAKHIRTARSSKKLADQFLGPFEILERHGKNAYSLKLPPKYGKLHHTFHVSLLQAYRARPGVEPPDPVDIDDEDEWEVQEILDIRKRRGKTEYYVRWKGYSEAHDSWEPEVHVRNAREAITMFTRKRKEREDNLLIDPEGQSERKSASGTQAKHSPPDANKDKGKRTKRHARKKRAAQGQ